MAEGFEIVVAAGGDGTINEVLNGIGDAPGGFDRARLGVLPLGTVNVFARELKIPLKLERAWEILRRGTKLKLICRAWNLRRTASAKRNFSPSSPEPVSTHAPLNLWICRLKKKIGPLAYVIAGLKALAKKK